MSSSIRSYKGRSLGFQPAWTCLAALSHSEPRRLGAYIDFGRPVTVFSRFAVGGAGKMRQRAKASLAKGHWRTLIEYSTNKGFNLTCMKDFPKDPQRCLPMATLQCLGQAMRLLNGPLYL